MIDSATCPESTWLLRNYHHCLKDRMDLWFDGRAEVLWEHGETSFALYLDDRSARLQFHPDVCRWSGASGDKHFEGSFDRVSKRMRQIFSGLP